MGKTNLRPNWYDTEGGLSARVALYIFTRHLTLSLSPQPSKIMSQSTSFINVEGVHNFRDIAAHSSHLATRPIRPGFIFRSAQPYSATITGIEQIRHLGITTIFDLRADAEIEETNKVTPLREIEGLNRISVPVFQSKEKKITGRLVAYFVNDTQTMMATYARMLTEGSNCFRRIFCHLRDHARDPCILQCALGKDRTGIATALILSLAGVPEYQIAEEYALTNIGLESYRPTARKFLISLSNFDWDESKVTAMLSVR